MDVESMQNLPSLLRERLALPLPGREAQSRFSPELSYGRHYGPPPGDVRQAAVLVLVYPHDGRWHVPFTVRPDYLPEHPGQVSFPGGAVEGSESSQQAALREFEEELGVTADVVDVLGVLTPLYVTVSNFWVTPWLAVAASRPAMHPDSREVEQLLEIPLASLFDAQTYGQHQIKRGGLSFTVPHFNWQTYRVWGATSMITAELVCLIDEFRAAH